MYSHSYDSRASHSYRTPATYQNNPEHDQLSRPSVSAHCKTHIECSEQEEEIGAEEEVIGVVEEVEVDVFLSLQW